MKHSIVVFLLLVSSLSRAKEPVLSSYRLEKPSTKTLDWVASRFEITHRSGDNFDVIVPLAQKNLFEARVGSARLLEADIKDEFRRREQLDSDWRAGYHSFEDVQRILKEYQEKFPGIVQVSQYGTSRQGNPLSVLKVAPPFGNPPEILITAATHGDEIITVEVVLAIMDKIITGYGNDPRLTRLVDSHQIYFIPVVNPDGFKNVDRYDNGVDPNRSYPWPGSQNASPSASIKPLMTFFADRKFTGSIDYHAFGELIMYPWAYTKSSVDNSAAQEFRDVSKLMADLNHYQAGQISQILYVAQGSSADYYFWKHKTIALGIEMGTSKAPSASKIPAVISANLESTLRFIEHF